MSDYLRPPEHPNEHAKFLQELCRVLNKRKPTIPIDSTAADVATLVTDFNALLAALRTAFD